MGAKMSRSNKKIIKIRNGDAAVVFRKDGKQELTLPSAKQVREGDPAFLAMFCAYALQDKETCIRVRDLMIEAMNPQKVSDAKAKEG